MSSGISNSSSSSDDDSSYYGSFKNVEESEAIDECCRRHAHNHNDVDTIYAVKVREWAKKIPIGLGLCPWAGKSQNRGLLRIVTCESDTPEGTAEIVRGEIYSLTKACEEGMVIPPLTTTLVVCPRIKYWEDYEVFDDFVRTGIKHNLNDDADILDNVTLVAFHPLFLRWHGLPSGIGKGSVVQCYWGIIGKKSEQTATATIIETANSAFGLRKVRVRYHDTLEGLGCQEQYVPIDWMDFSNEKLPEQRGQPLPDNFMYRSPYPTIHIIVNNDLASMSMRDVSRVKRINARRMAELGWEGLERRLGTMLR